MNGIYNPSPEQESRIPAPIGRRLHATETAERLLGLIVSSYEHKAPGESARQLAVNQSVQLEVQHSISPAATEQGQSNSYDVAGKSREELINDAREKLRGLTA